LAVAIQWSGSSLGLHNSGRGIRSRIWSDNPDRTNLGDKNLAGVVPCFNASSHADDVSNLVTRFRGFSQLSRRAWLRRGCGSALLFGLRLLLGRGCVGMHALDDARPIVHYRRVSTYAHKMNSRFTCIHRPLLVRPRSHHHSHKLDAPTGHGPQPPKRVLFYSTSEYAKLKGGVGHTFTVLLL
jgi:hypothetical protein